jgi:8-oxo-dGTP pyrophosphatase MutT (NUDIX family)
MRTMSETFRRRLTRALETHEPRRVSQAGARAAAVLIPVVGDAEPAVIFTLRTETVPSHKGQISFPGGSIDPGDASAAAAALREAEEEIGLRPTAVEVLGELDTFPTYVSGYVVTPIVGWLDSLPELVPNPAEVAQVLVIPLRELTDEIRSEPGFEHDGRTFPTEAWVWEGNVIWGVTARVIRGFLELLASAGLVDAPAGDGMWSRLPMPSRREGTG